MGLGNLFENQYVMHASVKRISRETYSTRYCSERIGGSSKVKSRHFIIALFSPVLVFFLFGEIGDAFEIEFGLLLPAIRSEQNLVLCLTCDIRL